MTLDELREFFGAEGVTYRISDAGASRIMVDCTGFVSELMNEALRLQSEADARVSAEEEIEALTASNNSMLRRISELQKENALLQRENKLLQPEHDAGFRTKPGENPDCSASKEHP